MLAKIIIKLILICLSNSFFNSFMKIKNGKRNVFRFLFYMKMKNEWEHWKFKVKIYFDMKIVVNYSNFVFQIEVKSKSNDKYSNSVFQFIKNTKWHFGYTDCFGFIKTKFITRLIKSEVFRAFSYFVFWNSNNVKRMF